MKPVSRTPKPTPDRGSRAGGHRGTQGHMVKYCRVTNQTKQIVEEDIPAPTP